MSSSVIDYFAVLGNKEGTLCYEPFRNVWSEEKNIITAAQVLDEAITDVAVISHDQNVPDETWTLLVESADGNMVEPPYLAIRRHVDSKRLDYITDIKLVLPSEQIPLGYELITSTNTGADSPSLIGRGFLAVKRADVSDVRYLHADPIIDDISFFKKSANEELPERFLEIDVLPASQQAAHLSGRNAADVSIVYHKRPGLGLCDLVYDSATIDRYPKQDHDKLELPMTGLPMFAFPDGMRFTLADAGQFPLPLFFTFVFTDQDGKHFYVAALQFFELVSEADLSSVFKSLHGEDQEFKMPAGKRIFCPKVICAVSQWPFYRAMRRFLRQLYSLSFSTLRCPLEYYIASVVHQVPFPLEGGRPFHVTLDVALISYTSKAMAPIEFALPSANGFPLMDVDFAGPLRCLSADHLLVVFALMLRESKLLFVCESNTMLTEVMETLRALLFPLSWSSCFVPRLPNALLGLLQAPGGFLIGVHIDSSAASDTPSSNDTSGHSTTAYLRTLHSNRNLVPGTYIIDLTANTVAQYTGRTYERLDAAKCDNILKVLPFGPKFRLQSALKKLCIEYSIGPQAVNLSEFDSAFELQSAEGLINAEKWENFPTLRIRDAFFAFLIDFLGDYSKYIIPPNEDLAADTYRTFQEEFAINQYLDLSEKSSRSTMELLLETQMFSALLQRRAEGRQQSLVFFERAGALVRELGLSAGGHGWNLPSRPAAEILELPIPVYGLLMADLQWAGLGVTRQQQLRSSSLSSTDSSASPGNYLTRHSLVYLSTGTMNVLRNGAIPMPYNITQPVTNQKLDDLLTMWDFINSALNYRVNQSVGAGNSSTQDSEISDTQRAREEINSGISELHLDNRAFGPLIMPGPCKPFGNEADARSFNYQAGWPVLNEDYTESALQEAVNPTVMAIRALRLNYEKQVGKDILLLVRPPGQRLAFEQHGKLLNPAARIGAPEEVLAVLSLMADIVSITLTALAVRTMHRCRPANDVLQMLGILAQLDHWELLPALSETVWRGVLLGCANAGGDLMRRICVNVYQQIPSATGQSPDSLTYGQYVRGLAAKKRHLGSLEPFVPKKPSKMKDQPAPLPPDPADAIIDAYLYLEEMGSTWYIQRSALQGQTLAMDESRHALNAKSAPVSPLQGALTKSLNLGRRFPAALSFRSAENSPGELNVGADKRSGPLIKLEAAKQTSQQFCLAEGPGLLAFNHPIAMLGISPPLRVGSFATTKARLTPGSLSQDLLIRMDQLYAGALPHIRLLSSASTAAQQGMGVIRERNDSTSSAVSAATISTASKSTAQGETSPVNTINPGRIASLSRRFFNNKKPNESSETEMTEQSASQTASSFSAPSSPLPVLGWAKKLRPAMFFGGGSPSLISSGSAAKLASNGDSNPNSARRTERTDSDGIDTSHVELKVLSATLNFDDEEDAEEDENEDADSAEEGDGKAEGGSYDQLSAAESPVPKNDSYSSLPSAENSPVPGGDNYSQLPSGEDSPMPLRDGIASVDLLEDGVASLDIEAESAARLVPSALSPTSPTSTCDTENLLDLDAAAEVVVDENTLFTPKDSDTESAPFALMSPSTEGEAPSDTADVPNGEASQQTETITAQGNSKASEVSIAEDVKSKVIDVVATQNHLIQTFSDEYITKGRVLGIHSFTPCSHCGCAMLDEEILTRWCHGSGYEAHIKGNTKSRAARDMFAVHRVPCKDCSELVTPQLHVTCFSSTAGGDAAVQTESSNGSSHAPPHTVWAESVPYLSPFGLRYELEALLMQYGALTVTTDWLHNHHRALLWGILWYSARLNLPSGLVHTGHTNTHTSTHDSTHDIVNKLPTIDFHSPVVVGWRECTVRALASRMLSGKIYDFLSVHELFPGCSSEDAEKLETVVIPALDGSPAMFRVAMVAFCECASVLESGQALKISTARWLNIGLLMLCYLYHKTNFTSPAAVGKLIHLNKDVLYEKIFVDTIKCVLSHVDLEKMGTTEAELLASCCSKTVIIVRNTVGFLY